MDFYSWKLVRDRTNIFSFFPRFTREKPTNDKENITNI